MPDIAMCSALCPDSHRCHRHADSGTAPSRFQSYWLHSGNQKLGAKGCEMFWPQECRPNMGAADAFMGIFGFTRVKNEEEKGVFIMDKLDGHPDFLGEFVPDNANDARQAEIDRLRAENERLSTAHELFEAACEDIALLQAENERLKSQWQPMETAPMDGSHILLYRPEMCFVGYYCAAGWCINAPGLPLMHPLPTRWRECW